MAFLATFHLNLPTLNFSLETTCRIHIPLTHHSSISVQALTPKLNPCQLPAYADSRSWPCPLINKHAIVLSIGSLTLTQSPSSFPCQKPTPYKVRVVFSEACPCSPGERSISLIESVKLYCPLLDMSYCTLRRYDISSNRKGGKGWGGAGEVGWVSRGWCAHCSCRAWLLTSHGCHQVGHFSLCI